MALNPGLNGPAVLPAKHQLRTRVERSTSPWRMDSHGLAFCSLQHARRALSGRCQRLSLLDDISDKNSGLGVAWLTARMRRFRRYLESVAGLDCPGWLTLDRKLETAFQYVGRFDARMRVPPDRYASVNRRFR